MAGPHIVASRLRWVGGFVAGAYCIVAGAYRSLGVLGLVQANMLTWVCLLGQGIPWDAYFGHLRAGCAKAGLTCLDNLDSGRSKIVMDSPYFYSMLSESFQNRTVDYWIPYLRAHVIYNLSPLLSQSFLNATFHIDSQLEGVEESPPRWKK